ncbi:hypothetical protein GCM10027056_25480 [Glaciibacter psychrotolerans]
MLANVNDCLVLWYAGITLVTIGFRPYGLGTVPFGAGELLALAILGVWIIGACGLRRWVGSGERHTRLNDSRSTLTALANGFEPRCIRKVAFTSIMAAAGTRTFFQYPRFVAPGIEFGTLFNKWHYVAVTLPAPLPHLILDATSNRRISTELPVEFKQAERLSLEGDFDKSFQLYSPPEYRRDALYVLTPDLMAALIDDAGSYNVEIIDSTLVFFTPRAADFSVSETWSSLDALVTNVVPRIVTKARRFRDERVPGQEIPWTLNRITAEHERPEATWVAPVPIIGPGGRRLNVRDRRGVARSILLGIRVYVVGFFLYGLPGCMLIVGFSNITEGL